MPRSLAKPELQCAAHAIKIHTAQSVQITACEHAPRPGGIGGRVLGEGRSRKCYSRHEFRFHSWKNRCRHLASQFMLILNTCEVTVTHK